MRHHESAPPLRKSHRVPLTEAMRSALECAGLELLEGGEGGGEYGGLLALKAAWELGGGVALVVTAETAEAVVSGIIEAANSESEGAEAGGEGAAWCARAARSLTALAGRVRG